MRVRFRAFLLLALGLFLASSPASAQSVVAAVTIRARSVIAASDLAISDRTVPGAFRSIADVAGLEARSIIYAGRAIMPGQVGPPALVHRNQLVKLIYRRGGLSITADGRALGRAGRGEAVRVMNTASRATVTGIVAAPGIVKVMP